jgi:hypothetical protein
MPLADSHADGDDTRFYAVAWQVAAQAARSGHAKFAQELRDLVDQLKAVPKAVKPVRGVKPVPLVQPRGELAGLFTPPMAVAVGQRREHATRQVPPVRVEYCTRQGFERPPPARQPV